MYRIDPTIRVAIMLLVGLLGGVFLSVLMSGMF